MNEKKNTMLIVAASGLGKTGVPNVICQVVFALSELFEIDIAVFNDEDYFYPNVTGVGAHIIRIDEKKPNGYFKKALWRVFFENRIIAKAFSNLFCQKHYDVVHSFREYDSAQIFKVAYKHGISKRIIHCNNEIKRPVNPLSNFLFNRKEKAIRKFTTHLIGVSSECCKKSYPGMNFEVLFNTYDEKKFNLSVPFVKENELVLTQIATYSKRKNQLFTIKVFAKILKIVPSAKLQLIGTEVESGYLNQAISLADDLFIRDRVEFIDGSNDFYNNLVKTTYILLPSLSEAAPISLVEAQACGIKCFASSNITRDVDCGGVVYLGVEDEEIWSNAIVKEYETNSVYRNAYNVTKFSRESFNKKITYFYKS